MHGICSHRQLLQFSVTVKKNTVRFKHCCVKLRLFFPVGIDEELLIVEIEI